MILNEMLRILRNEILHDRSDLVAGDEDKLWSDTTLVGYINEAQIQFARETLCILDGTSPVTRFTTVADTEIYTLDPSVLAVQSVQSLGNGGWVNGVYVPGTYAYATTPPYARGAFTPAAAGTATLYPDKAELAVGGHSYFNSYTPPDTCYFDVNQLSTLPPGKPLAYSTDEYGSADANGSTGVINMRLYPLPSAAFAGCVMQMRVCRLPMNPLSPSKMQAAPEVPAIYHLPLLDYAAYLALRIVDHEIGDPQRAADFLASYGAKVADCKKDMRKRRFVPLNWGFGRNGYSYTPN